MLYVCLISAGAGALSAFFFSWRTIFVATLVFVVAAIVVALCLHAQWPLAEIFASYASLQGGYLIAGIGIGAWEAAQDQRRAAKPRPGSLDEKPSAESNGGDFFCL